MPEKITVPKSLNEEIIEELIKRLRGKDGFDTDLIEKIGELSRSGELKSHAKVQTLLKKHGEIK